MNKSDKLISIVLALALAGWLWHSISDAKKQAEAAREAAAVAATNIVEAAVAPVSNAAPAVVTAQTEKLEEGGSIELAAPKAPEKTVVLSNAQMAVTLTTRGAAVKDVTFFGYAEKPGAISADNPAVRLDFSEAPALEITGGANLVRGLDYEIVRQDESSVTFKFGALERTITLGKDYRISLKDAFGTSQTWGSDYAVSLGAMPMDASKNGLLSIDSFVSSPVAKEQKVKHWGEEDPLKSYLVAGVGGCSGKKDATAIPAVQTVAVPSPSKWLAVKNRFFVSALASATLPISGFDAVVSRVPDMAEYKLRHVSASAKFAGCNGAVNEMTFYLGPKKQDLLWDLGMKDVMEFGMWRWVCYPMVWVLNLFHSWIPNYGIAIILLTILVRLVFWPLTHKSTVSMRRMSEIQPKIKEIREKFKDNPQRLQQETWAVYRDNKVNPAASCLPMLIQIPVFIALFTVLRSAVELRYAPFLWIVDLSEPEALGATSWFPFFGGLNILPILMAATMALQSALTPSAGDKNQQRMMMVMMPAMMLFMFYSFPSALSLYWTLSQVLSIVQMWYIRKRYTPAPVAASADVVDVPVTRQMRRHGA